jgi:DNA polymerase V
MGFRTHEEEDALDTMSIDDFLIENKEATFMLRVHSDAMSHLGILRGDLVVADRSKNPYPGNIVIAAIDGSFVMAYFEDLHKESKVEAVVTAVIRKY